MAALQLASKPTSHLLLPAEAEFVDKSRKFLDHRRRQGSFVLVCRANTVVLLAATKEGNQAKKKATRLIRRITLQPPKSCSSVDQTALLLHLLFSPSLGRGLQVRIAPPESA